MEHFIEEIPIGSVVYRVVDSRTDNVYKSAIFESFSPTVENRVDYYISSDICAFTY
jgi:hypothetical protein